MKTAIEMAKEACDPDTAWVKPFWMFSQEELERLVDIVRAEERERIINVLLEMHDKASSLHNYYKHAALEINRK